MQRVKMGYVGEIGVKTVFGLASDIPQVSAAMDDSRNLNSVVNTAKENYMATDCKASAARYSESLSCLTGIRVCGKPLALRPNSCIQCNAARGLSFAINEAIPAKSASAAGAKISLAAITAPYYSVL